VSGIFKTYVMIKELKKQKEATYSFADVLAEYKWQELNHPQFKRYMKLRKSANEFLWHLNKMEKVLKM